MEQDFLNFVLKRRDLKVNGDIGPTTISDQQNFQSLSMKTERKVLGF